MNILITGGGGFIGSHLVERLVGDGHRVRVLDNFSTGRRGNLAAFGDDVEVIEGDIQSYERAHRAVRDCEVVFHHAALPSVPRSVQDPLTSNASNVIGTLNVLLAARDGGARRVVLASSSSVYGANPDLPKVESMRTAPMSPYAVSKLAGEGYARSFHDVYGLDTVSLRYFNVFGARQDPSSQYSAVIPKFITAALDGENPVIFGDGAQSRDFTYIDNVVEANLLAMDREGIGGEIVNVACGERITLNEVVAELGEIMDTELDPSFRPPRVGDVPHSFADIGRARDVLGFAPAVGFREGLRRTVDHFARLRDRQVA